VHCHGTENARPLREQLGKEFGQCKDGKPCLSNKMWSILSSYFAFRRRNAQVWLLPAPPGQVLAEGHPLAGKAEGLIRHISSYVWLLHKSALRHFGIKVPPPALTKSKGASQ
jgi:hypothetical protein